MHRGLETDWPFTRRGSIGHCAKSIRRRRHVYRRTILRGVLALTGKKQATFSGRFACSVYDVHEPNKGATGWLENATTKTVTKTPVESPTNRREFTFHKRGQNKRL